MTSYILRRPDDDPVNELDIEVIDYDKFGKTVGVGFEGETIMATIWLGLSELSHLRNIIDSAEAVLKETIKSDEDYVKEALKLVDERNRVG